jgi:uncharacterized protein YcbX
MTALPLAARIRSLHVYPVKSCRGIDLATAQLAERGLAWDRYWMIVDPAGRFLTQRTQPRLACVSTAFTAGGVELQVAGQAPLTLPFDGGDDTAATASVRVWDDTVQAAPCGAAADAWISRALGTAAHVVRATAATQRQPAPRWRGELAAPVSFADGFPLLVCNAASLEDLAARLPQPAALPMDRFRPNVVLEGIAAWAEDQVQGMQTDRVALRLAKPCTRCVITSRDQSSGEPGSDPLPALRKFRFDRELKGVTFGWNALIESGAGASLRAGETVRLQPRVPPATPEPPQSAARAR